MKIKNSTDNYGVIAKIFHWSMAAIILGMVTSGLTMTSLAPGDIKWMLYKNHKAFGLIILSLIPLRILWRLVNETPKLPTSTPKWQVAAAEMNIKFLYLAMLVMPSSGFLMSTLGGHNISFFDLFTIEAFGKIPFWPGVFHDTHHWIGYILVGSIIIHIGAALHHHFILKDNVLNSMLKY